MIKCPACQNEDRSMMEFVGKNPRTLKLTMLCAVCSKLFYIDESERIIEKKDE